jgi:hypothetical protein
MRFDSLLRMADKSCDLQVHRQECGRSTARRPPSCPSRSYGDNGSGMHTHQSLWKDGKPLFAGDRLCRPEPNGAVVHRRHPEAHQRAAGHLRADHQLLPPPGAGLRGAGRIAYSARNRSAASASRCIVASRPRPSASSSAAPTRRQPVPGLRRHPHGRPLDGIKNKRSTPGLVAMDSRKQIDKRHLRVAYLSPNEVRPFSIGFGFFYTPGLKAAVLSAARWSIEDLSAEVVSPETVARELNDTALPDFVSASIPSDFSLWGAFGVEGTRSEAEFISGAQLDWSTFGDVGRIDSLALSGIILEPPTHPRNVSEIYRAEWMGVSTQWHPWVWNDSTSDQALLIVWLPPNMRGIRNEGAEAPVIVHALSRPLGMLRVNRF